MSGVEQLSSLLAKTLDSDPGVRSQAEEGLVALSTSSPGHVPSLLELIASAQTAAAIRLAASIHLKNLIRARWDADEAQDAGLPVVDESTKATLRQNLLPLLLSLSSLANPTPLPLRLQLNTSLSLVASHDFPRAWTGLLDDILARLSEPNPDLGVVQACLSTLHEVTKAWRGQFRSDELYEEINYVLEKFAPVWWSSIQSTNQALLNSSTPAAQMPPLLTILHTQVLLFYDLSCQDLPPLFEDNIAPISQLLLHWLSFSPDSSRLPSASDDDDKPDDLTNVRAAVCEAAELYAQRYLDVWEPQVGGFVQAVWEMLGKLEGKSGSKHDALLSRALSFLSVIVRQPSLRHLFSQGEGGSSVMESLVQRVVLPNVGMKEVEEEMFEDEPLAWVKREVEGSTETDTPRLSSLSFLRALLEHFTQDITRIISSYIQTYLQQYAANPSAEWRKKDAAIWLMTGVAARGTTGRHGVSQSATNQLVNVVEFFSNHIFADLQASESSGSVHPVLKVDAIRYLHTFRNQLTKEQLLSVMPLLVQHLQSDNVGIATYAAIAVESILVLKDGKSPLFTPSDVQPFAEPTLMALFTKIEAGGTPERVAENEFLIKGVMRVLTTGREQLAGQAYSTLLEHLANIVTIISRNPSNPRFSQFTFESVAALIRYATQDQPTSVDAFEQTLFPPFLGILQQDVSDFIPFVFQLLSQLLELRSTGSGLPSSYQSLLPSLLTPALWQSRGNVPALVRLLQAYLAKASATMVSNNQIPAVLGIYQQLIASRINDEFGFELMQTVFETVDEAALQPYRQAIMTLMLTRLQNSRTDKFSRGFVAFVAGVAAITSKKEYPEATIAAFDAVQPGLFTQLVQGVIAPEVAKVPARKRPLVIVGLGRLLTQSSSTLPSGSGGSSAIWPPLLSALVTLSSDSSIAAKSIEAQQAEEDQLFAEDWEEQNTFQAGFSKLAASAPRSTADKDAAAVKAITGGKDVREWLVESVVQASQRTSPGALPAVLAGMDPAAGQALQQMVSAKGLSIQ
ncbi:unnamed protein product [Jaminaea pallidilutea]